MRYRLLIVLMMAFCSFTASAWAVTYTYDDLNRLHEVILDNGQKITYEYDEVGNIISRTGRTFTVSLAADPNGSVTGTTPQTLNYGGSTTPVTAVPNAGYHFTNWTAGSSCEEWRSHRTGSLAR